MYIKRSIEGIIKKRLFDNKVVIIYGPRQCGKTTLVKNLLQNYENSKYFLCEIPSVRDTLSTKSPEQILSMFGDSKLIVLDEAQTIPDIGVVLKLMTDLHPEVQIIATGSSSFDLSNRIIEPLTGRKYEFTLLPLSLGEILKDTYTVEVNQMIERNLIFGQYPGIYTSSTDKSEVLLQELSNSYLFKDILAFQNIKNSELLLRLLQMLALQIGNEVSYTELGTALGIDKGTVQRYIDLLEKIFVIHRLTPFSRNLRKELNKKRKIYFYDLGIRNAIIRNFNPLILRQDVGALWENYCINERLKYLYNNEIFANRYFWRTWNGNEIDYLEERNGILSAYEFKWNNNILKFRAPKVWSETYPDSNFVVINRSNINIMF